MAYQDFGSCWIPSLWPAPVTSNQLIDASGEMVGMLCYSPVAGTLTGCSFMTATVTTGDTVKVSHQGLTTGDPDGVVGGSVTQVINSTDDNTVFDVTFGTGRTLAKNEAFFIVIEFNSFVAGSINIRGITNNSGALAPLFKNMYCDLKTGGTWAKNSTSGSLVALNFGGTYYPCEGLLIPGNQQVTYNNGSTPDEYALYFNSPVPLKVDAAAAYLDVDGAIDMVLYDSDGTTSLASFSLDTNIRSSNIIAPTYAPFSTTITLAKNTNYRVSVKPTSATNITLAYVDASAAKLAQLGCGTGVCLSTRTDAGAWTQTATQRPAIFLHATAFDDGAGTGGGGAYILGC